MLAPLRLRSGATTVTSANSASAARGSGARLVYAGSSSAYGNQVSRQKHEDLREDPLSPYAAAKLAGELYCRSFARVYGMSIVVTRFFNVFGPNEYHKGSMTSVVYNAVQQIKATGTVKLFRSLHPDYRDGEQRRDFVSVYDVARALRLAIETPAAVGQAFNVGSGQSASVSEIASRMAALVDAEDIEPQVTGAYRVGDIRHCFADITRARTVLGYEPQITLEAGLMELAGWLSGQQASDRVAEANAELSARGLTA